MSSVVNGTNIVLYAQGSNAKYYFNGGVSMGTIATKTWYQLGQTENTGASANIGKAGDGRAAGFITNLNYPGQTTIPAGTWTFVNYLDITFSLDYSPGFYYKIFKYDGTNFTLLATSATKLFTDTAKKMYTTTVAMPLTALNETDRIAVEIWTVNVDTRDVIIYTQGDNDSYVTTTLFYYSAIGASTNCTFDVSTEQIEVTSQCSSWFKQFKNDVSTWNITCDGFISITGFTYLNLLQLQLNRTPMVIKFSIDNDNGNGSGTYGYSIFNGTANITNISIAGPVENTSTYSLSLQGTGPYTISGTQAPTNGDSMVNISSVRMLTYTAAGGEASITFATAIGYSCISVTRGGVEVRSILSSGTPTGEDVTFNSSTGVLTFASGRALEADEFVRAIFK
jgi:predicted secreted protein